MQTLSAREIEEASGGISGYEGAGVVLAVVGFGVLVGPVGAVTLGVAIGAAGGMAIAQWWANFTHP